MKILHVIASVHKRGGGTSEVVPRLARAQKAMGHEVVLAVAHQGEVSDAARTAFEAGVVYKPYPRLRHLSALGLSPELRRGLRTLVAEADIVHTHGLWQAPIWYAAREARRQGKPYVMMSHGFLNLGALRTSKWEKKILGTLFERRNLNRASGLVATAESEAASLRAYGLKRPIHIMPIGLDLEPIDSGRRNEELLKRLGCDLTKKHILYLSRISPIKGLDMLCEAWGRVDHTDWQLVIVGPDDRGYAAEMRALYSEHVAEGSVVFHGPIFGSDKYDLLKSVEASVLPSRSENWSISVAEAMASGLPVVCTKGAPWGCISEVGAGAWVDISVDGITYGLSQLMNASADLRMSMGRRGREWVEGHLGWTKIAKEMVAFYETMIAQYHEKGGL